MNNGNGPYSHTKVIKLECINHVQKRLGTRLRKLWDEEKVDTAIKKGIKIRRSLLGFSRLSFVAQSAILDHNFGYQKACLLIAFNIKSKALRKSLTVQEQESKRHSQAQKMPKTERKEEKLTHFGPGAF